MWQCCISSGSLSTQEFLICSYFFCDGNFSVQHCSPYGIIHCAKLVKSRSENFLSYQYISGLLNVQHLVYWGMLHQDLDLSWVSLCVELEHLLHSCFHQSSSHVVCFACVYFDHCCIFHVFLLWKIVRGKNVLNSKKLNNRHGHVKFEPLRNGSF